MFEHRTPVTFEVGRGMALPKSDGLLQVGIAVRRFGRIWPERRGIQRGRRCATAFRVIRDEAGISKEPDRN